MKRFICFLILMFMTASVYAVGYMDMGNQGVKSDIFAITNSSNPDASADGYVFIGAKDATSDARSTLNIYFEVPVTTGDVTPDSYIPIWINNTPYKLPLKAY